MYVPVLKWKMGEKKALENLSETCKNTIMPLFELQPCTSKDDLDNIVDKFVDDLKKSWNVELPFLLDTSNFNVEGEFENEHDYFAKFILQNLANFIKIIPVIPFEYKEEFALAIIKSKDYLTEGIAIRIKSTDFMSLDSLNSYLTKISFTRENIYLIIDFQEVTEPNIQYQFFSAKSVLKDIDDINEFKNIIFLGTGYPTTYPSTFMEGEKYKSIDRIELQLWNWFKTKGNFPFAKKIIPGDYCCSNSIPMPADVSQMRPSAIIKYTTEDAWHFWRGIQLIKGGHGQYFALCRDIIKQTGIYKGESYSWGDLQIKLCAYENRSCGNPTTWVQIATNHHITLVSQQFSNSPFV